MGLDEKLQSEVSVSNLNKSAADVEIHEASFNATSLDESNFEEQEIVPQKKKSWRENFAWYDPGMDRREKWLLFKIDTLILTYTCIASFSLNLDMNNVKNAYVRYVAAPFVLTYSSVVEILTDFGFKWDANGSQFGWQRAQLSHGD